MQNNITFIGQTFAGKTTTGKNVAKQIGYKFKDLDEEVQKKMEMSIAEMWKILNDPYDLRIETLDDMKNIFIEVYEDLLKEEKTIISIGAYFLARFFSKIFAFLKSVCASFYNIWTMENISTYKFKFFSMRSSITTINKINTSMSIFVNKNFMNINIPKFF